MNFRVNLAVAFAAAFSFACSEKPAATPDLKAALNAPQGMKVIGLYRMDVTPVSTPQGMVYDFQPIPVGSDGNPSTNPPGTVQVKGAFGAVTPWAGPSFVRCANGVNTISAPVQITNFAVETLTNVWAQVIDMSGTTGNVACNPNTGSFTITENARGTWQYSNLSGAPDDTGLLAGGNSLPLNGAWTFRYVTTQPFRFFFRVMAENSSPVPAVVDPAGPVLPLTWTASTANSRIEICPVDPSLGGSAFVQNPCPVPLTAAASVAASNGAAPYAFSYAPTVGFVNGNTYYWRVRNVYPGGPSRFYSAWNFFTYQGANIAAPVVSPLTVPANVTASTAFLSWTTDPAVTQTYVYLCQNACPANLPAPPPAAQGNVLFQGAYQDLNPGVTSSYSEDFLVMTPVTTAATGGAYLDPAITYDFRVFAYDGVTLPTSGPAGATAAITITPVAEVPTITSPVGVVGTPVVFSIANDATFTVTWTSDLLMPDTVFELVDLNDPTGLFLPFYTSPVAPAPGALTGVPNVPVAGVNNYTVDLKPLTLGAGNYTFTVYNTDLLGVVGAVSYFDVTP